MKFGRTYNKKDNEVFIKDNEDGSIDIISDDWNEFKVVQDKIDNLTTQKALRNSNQYRNK